MELICRKIVSSVCCLSLLSSIYAQSGGEGTTPPANYDEVTANEIKQIDKKGKKTGKVPLAAIMTFGVAFAAPLVLTTCGKKISAWIFAASGGYFLVSELLNSKEHKIDSEKVAEEYKALAGNRDKQIVAIENAAKASERTAQSGRKRSKNLKIVALGFAAAAAAALAESFWGTPPGGACSGGGSSQTQAFDAMMSDAGTMVNPPRTDTLLSKVKGFNKDISNFLFPVAQGKMDGNKVGGRGTWGRCIFSH